MNNNLIEKFKLLIAIVLVFMTLSCSSRIVRYKYSRNFRGYKIVAKKLLERDFECIARTKEGKKIQDKNEIKEFVEEYNKKPFQIDMPIKWSLTEKKKFKLAELYYGGMRAYKKKDFQKAIDYFNQTIEFDKNVIKYSDVYYLIAKSYYYLGENEKAQEYFKKFIEYSESITHSNFHYFLNDNKGEKISELFNDAESHLIEDPKDKGHNFALKHHKEDYYAKYKNRYYKPGFIMGKYSNMGLIILGVYYSERDGFGGYAGIYARIFKKMDFDSHYLCAEKLKRFYIALPFSIYSDNHKRFGIKFMPGFYYISEELEQPDKKFWKSYPNVSGNISIGFYINHYWLIYTGYKYYYYNKNNPYEFTTEKYWWKLWNSNNYYLGNTVFLYKNFGITIEYSNKNILTYLEIYFIKLGYNISEDEVFLHFFDLSIE